MEVPQQLPFKKALSLCCPSLLGWKYLGTGKEDLRELNNPELIFILLAYLLPLQALFTLYLLK